MKIIKKLDIPVNHIIKGLLYGSPGIGKSTLACSLGVKSLFFDTESGIGRVSPNHRTDVVPVSSFFELIDFLERNQNDMREYDTIIVDSYSKLVKNLEKTIIDKNQKGTVFNGMLSQKGYGVRKQYLDKIGYLLTTIQKNVIIVSHENKEDLNEQSRMIPDIKRFDDLLRDFDFCFRYYYVGNERVLGVNGQDLFISKNTARLEDYKVPHLKTDEENNFLQKVFSDIMTFREKEQSIVETKINESLELSKKYIEDIDAIDSLELLNGFLGTIKEEGGNILSKHKININKALETKSKLLNCSYSKQDGKYVQNDA